MASDVRRNIGDWVNSHPRTFTLSTVEKLSFKIICDDSWNPMFVSADEEASEALLSDGLGMVNMDLQVNNSQSLYQVLTRAHDALSAIIKLQQESQPSIPVPTPTSTPDTSTPTPSIPAVNETTPTLPPISDSIASIPSTTPSTVPPTSTTTYTPIPTPTPVTQTTEGSGMPPNSEPSVRIRAEVEQWKRENGYVGLLVNSMAADQFKADLSLSVQGIPCSFQILFDENWLPMIVVSNDIQLEDIITHTNVLLEEQQNQILTNSGDEPPPRYTLVEVLNVFGAAFNNELRDKNLVIPEEDKVTPTAEDWEATIIPSCITYMNSSGIAGFEREEWIRRVRIALKQQNVNKAFTIITQEIFGGAPLPSAISRFIPTRLVRPLRQSSGGVDYNTSDGIPEAVERLNNELLLLRASSAATARQFVVTPINNELFLWAVRLIYDPTTAFGQSLIAFYKKSNAAPFSKIIRIGNHANSPEVHLEMKFPPNYPNEPPLIRVIRPRFLSTTNIETFFGETTDSLSTTTTTTTTTSTRNSSTSNESSTESPESDASNKRRGLSISHNFETALSNWDPSFSVVDILKQLHHIIQRHEVDVEHANDEYALPTVGTFWRLYTCEDAGSRLDIEHGGKIVLPPSAIEDLASQEFGDVNNFDRAEDTTATPMTFELSPSRTLKNENGVARTFCGVAEFTAFEGTLVMPKWMMNNLGIRTGDLVQVRRVSLPRGSFLRLLPHHASFLQHTNPKALLEWVLPHYVALTPGDIIKISFDDKEHVLQVLEVSPGRAVCLTDSDVTVDFAPPLNSSPSTSSPVNVPTPNEPASSLSTTPTKGGSTLGTLEHGNGVEGVDFQTCTNCFAPVPKERYTMHSLSCPRINWYCDKCKKVVQRSQKDDHLTTVHAPVPCPLGCDTVLEAFMVADHVAKECTKRNRECDYCGLSITAANWHSHESACGDRTEICEACGIRVQKREQFKHLSVCGTKPVTPFRPVFTPSTPPPQRAEQEDLFQCDKCMAWCAGFDELQVHMLTQHHEQTEDAQQ